MHSSAEREEPMRVTPLLLTAAAVLVASTASAQAVNTPPPEPNQNTDISTLPNLGTIDFGFRGTLYAADSDEARYQRYRDLRNGAFAEGFRYGKENDTQVFDVRATHVGYRDQNYVANFNRYGKVRASFEFNQIPLFYSQDTSTLYTSPSPGTLLLPDSIQTGLQNKTITLPQVAPLASQFDLRQKRSITDFRLIYTATPDLDLSVSFKNTHKIDEQPWAGTFGFSDAVELPAPLDTRTTEVGAAAEWTRDRGEIRVGYDGSFFRNEVSTLVWDNPLRITDSPTAGPVQGRMSLWPDSNANSGSVSGFLKLPYRSQANAYLSLGDWSQNQPLIPFTINTALPTIPLDRANADTSARITSSNLDFNSRPRDDLWFNVRFRSYDFDNRTPIFHVGNTVAYDTTVEAYANGGTSPFSFTRKTFDADASWTPITHAAFRAAYTREAIDQTFRTFDSTTENRLRLSVDATAIRGITLRGVYEYAKRTGSGLDEQSLDDIGEQVSLRQFDISDFSQHRFSAIAMYTLSQLSFNGTVSVGRDDRPGDVFGLRSSDSNGVGVGVDYVPSKAVSMGATYQYEKYTALSASRQANPGPQFDDPTRDWTTDSADHAHTVTASADLLKLWPKTDVRFSYDFVHGQTTYVYGLAPNTTLPPVSQLPPIFNTRNRVTADGRYFITEHLAAGLVWWFEKYNVDDFAFNPSTLNSIAQPSFLMLGYVWRPYTANTFWLRLTYVW
jgi:MtrB/PioB family decaheme-associated outer membrane protein